MDNTQRKTVLEKLDEVLEGTATYEDVAQVIETFAKAFLELKSDIAKKLAENKGIAAEAAKPLRKEFEAIDKELRALLAKNGEKSSNDLKNAVQSLTQKVNSVEKSIPPVADFSDIRRSTADLADKFTLLSRKLTAESVRDLLELLKGDEKLDASAIRVEVSRGTYRNLEDVIRELLKDMKMLRSSTAGGGAQGGRGGSIGTGSPVVHEKLAVSAATTELSVRLGIGAEGNAIWLRYQGQMLNHDVDYSVNGNKITFINYEFEDDTFVSVTYWP